MLKLKAPLTSGTDTEIDLIEHEMEGGVMVDQPPEIREHEIHEHSVEETLGGLIKIEEHIDVRELLD